MAGNTREKRAETIADLCARHNCDKEVAKSHFVLYMDEGWCVHPSASFEKWWQQHPDQEGVEVVTAYNTGSYRAQFMEARKFGIAV
jgi:hypothetical protein